MKDEKQQNDTNNDLPANNEEQETLDVKNPFNKNDDKKITQEDVENEQTFKEAQTERD